MNPKAIISELEEERDRLDRPIQALKVGRCGRRRERLSAAARRRISEGMKRRWAERKRKRKAA